MGRILPRPSGTTLAQPACVARAWPTTWLAQPHAVARAHSRAWPGACAAAATALAMVARRFHGQHTPPTMRGGHREQHTEEGNEGDPFWGLTAPGVDWNGGSPRRRLWTGCWDGGKAGKALDKGVGAGAHEARRGRRRAARRRLST
jgi:hypothetical protein